MKIYIAKDYGQKPLAVIMADDKEKAEIAFSSSSTGHHSIEEVDPTVDGQGVHGVVFLLTSEEVSKYDLPRERIDTIRIWSRGL